MHLSTASIAFAVLLAASLAGKAVGLKETNRAGSDDDRAVAYLEERGLTLNSADPHAASMWTVATRGACRVRFAIVAPQGWSQTIVAEQTVGEHLMYAFDGQFYAQQPTIRTRLENYRRRLVRYFGYPAPDLQIRAIAVSPACPDELFGSEAALQLSQ
jgi:hypothetical protein